MNGCLNCRAAAEAEHHDFSAGCTGCCARAAARSPHFRRVRDAGMHMDSPYKRLLVQFGLQHEDVRAAAAADRLGAT